MSKGSIIKLALLGMAILLLVSVIVPLLVPVSYIKPEVEYELGQAMGKTVKIGSLDLRLIPSPRILANDVSIANQNLESVHLNRVVIIPDFSAFFAGELILKRIDLRGLVLEHNFLESMYEEMKANTSGSAPSPLHIKRITAKSLHFRLEKDKVLGPYAFDLDLSAKGNMDRLHFYRQDETAHIHLSEKDKAFEVRLFASNWQIPAEPAIRFTRLDAKGYLYKNRLALKHISADAYGGSLESSAEFNWETSLNIFARLKMDSITSGPIMQVFSYPVIKGKASGDVHVKLSGQTVDDLFINPHVEGNLRFSNGAIYNTEELKRLLRFSNLEVAGVLDGENLKIDSLQARAYSGSFSAKGEMDWQSDWRINGMLTGVDVDVESLLADLTGEKIISGKFKGSANLQLYAEEASQLLYRPYINGNFYFNNGVIYKADLEKAASSRSGKDGNNGQTPFDELKGNIHIQERTIKLTDLKIKSPDMDANGYLDVSAERKLDGVLDVGLHKTSSVVSIPVQISGTLDKPSMHPTKSAMVGGTVGTAILGPVLGTAIGVKVGSFLSKITGDSKDKGNQEKQTSHGEEEF